MAADGALIPNDPFGEFRFPRDLEPRLSTRLGLDDRRLVLGDRVTGPFGRPVDEISIPGHLAGGLDVEAADSVEATADGLVIRAGGLVFRYSRFGLEKIDEPAHG